MKGNEKMTKLMALELILIWMELSFFITNIIFKHKQIINKYCTYIFNNSNKY